MGLETDFIAWNAETAAGVIAGEAHREGALLPMLHALMRVFGHVPDAATPLLAETLNLSRADVHGVLSFYADLRRTPPPAHVLKLCRAEACQARGGEALAAQALARLSGRTDLAIEDVYCLGLCASGPAALLDGRPVARLDIERLDRLLAGAAP